MLSEETKSYIEKGLTETDKEALKNLITKILKSKKKIFTWNECISFINTSNRESKLSLFEDLNIYKRVKSSSVIKLRFDINLIKNLNNFLK